MLKAININIYCGDSGYFSGPLSIHSMGIAQINTNALNVRNFIHFMLFLIFMMQFYLIIVCILLQFYFENSAEVRFCVAKISLLMIV